MNDKAISVIREYIEEYLFEPKLTWIKSEFRKRAYSRWAAYEILGRIMDETAIPSHIFERESKRPAYIIEEFMDEMDEYCDLSSTREQKIIFLIARDLAEELLYILSKSDEYF